MLQNQPPLISWIVKRPLPFLFPTLLLLFSGCDQEDISLAPVSKDAELSVMQKGNPVARPFKGTFQEVLVDEVDPACDCGDFIVLGTAGTGNFTHLGKLTSATTVCLEKWLYNENGDRIGASVASVCLTLVAANGDELYLIGKPHVNLLDPSCFCVRGEPQFDIVGGTGRFENTSGSATLDLNLDVTTLIYSFLVDGVIYY